MPTDHVDSRGADDNAVQQLYVRLQQFQETLATILQAARNELVKQVQNATSTTTHEEPMKRVDRLFKLRSYLGAVHQRNELEPATTEESSTPRLNRALSTQMYYILVMMKTLNRCRNASVSEEFAGRRQFVREWEARFVGLLRNVLSCRCKDDVPTQLPVEEGLTHESQSSEIVIDDIMTYVKVLRMGDGRVKACLIRESTRITSWCRCERKSSRSREHNSTLPAILCQCRSVFSRRARAKASMARTQGTNRLRK